ncbi:hypothetical protein V8C35DRAFT_299469 [Trichoderma chlorosporum]
MIVMLVCILVVILANHLGALGICVSDNPISPNNSLRCVRYTYKSTECVKPRCVNLRDTIGAFFVSMWYDLGRLLCLQSQVKSSVWAEYRPR